MLTNDNFSIKQKIKQNATRNANSQGVHCQELPSWITTTSWWIGGIIGVCILLPVIITLSEDNALINGAVIFVMIAASILGGLMCQGISYAILVGIYRSGKAIKKGAVIAANKGGKLLDSTKTSIGQQVTSTVEINKSQVEIALEKQKLQKHIYDLELQCLQKRVRELEQNLNSSNKEEETSKFKEAVRNAWKQEDLKTFQKLLTENPDFDDIELEGGMTLLMAACINGDVKTVRHLIQKGANVDAQSHNEDTPFTPLLFTCLMGTLDVLKELIEAGADIEIGEARMGSTPLIIASHLGKYDMVKTLLDAGANIDAQNNLGATALILASAGGHDKIVRLLLDRGANVNIIDKKGGNAFIRAIIGKHKKIGEMLLDAGAHP